MNVGCLKVGESFIQKNPTESFDMRFRLSSSRLFDLPFYSSFRRGRIEHHLKKWLAISLSIGKENRFVLHRTSFYDPFLWNSIYAGAPSCGIHSSISSRIKLFDAYSMVSMISSLYFFYEALVSKFVRILHHARMARFSNR